MCILLAVLVILGCGAVAVTVLISKAPLIDEDFDSPPFFRNWESEDNDS